MNWPKLTMTLKVYELGESAAGAGLGIVGYISTSGRQSDGPSIIWTAVSPESGALVQ